MKLKSSKFRIDENSVLNYYEYHVPGDDKPKLLMLHAQGTDSLSFQNVIAKLSKSYHLYLVDYYGHGGSSKNTGKYNLDSIGQDIIAFIESVICGETIVLGHSSGGLIAAYVAANCSKCVKLILEDPPFFSSQGERRYNTYNYKDLSSVCHSFLSQNSERDFVYYYFLNQYCWNFFPEASAEKIRSKLSAYARKYRSRHPEKNLRVPFWPKRFLEAFRGMQHYDPIFGEAFFTDSFHESVDYCQLLSKIRCEAVFLKANTTSGEGGLLQGALSEEDLENVRRLVPGLRVIYFNCGHAVHSEKPKQFIDAVTESI